MIDSRKIQILLILIFAFAISNTNAQNSGKGFASPSRVKKIAKNANRSGDIYSAIDYYKIYTDAKPANYKAIYELAELYRRARNYEQAEIYYKKAYDANNKKFVKALYFYALMQKSNGKYKDAEENFLKFKKKGKNLKDSKKFRKLSKSNAEGCKIAPTIIDSVIKVYIQHLDTSVNKAHIEFSPVSLSEDKLLFASLRTDKVKYYNPNDTTKKLPVRNFYIAKKENGKWKTTGKYPHEFNNAEDNVGNGALSPDGTKFYFTKTTKNWRNEMISQIWMCKKEGQSWSEPELLPYPVNDPLYTTTQPSVGIESKKGFDMIFFVSDRMGGKGDLDIWYTLYDKNKDRYLKPKNAGSKINTVGDEITPFYDMDTRTLYYSSTGKVGIGGFDIFKSTGELKKWTNPQNIGYPLNSSADDIYFIVGKDREGGFFTSNRLGGITLKNPTCCDDIYSYNWTEYIHISVKGDIFANVKTVNVDTQIVQTTYVDSSLFAEFDSLIITKNDSLIITEDSILSKSSLQNAKLSLYLVVNNDSINETMFLKSFNSLADGNYNFTLEQGQKYKLVAEKEGYFNNQLTFNTKDISGSKILIENLELKKIPTKSIVLDNIYYEFDKATLTSNAKNTIDTTIYEILVENKKLIVELSSHTDRKVKMIII